jgi:hypothetical protein
VGTFFFIWDSIAELPAAGIFSAASRFAGLYGGLVMLILATNPFILNLYRLSFDGSSMHYFSRLGAQFKLDYHSAVDYIAQHAAPGDVIIADGPGAHLFFFYTGHWPSATMDSMLAKRIIYEGGMGTPFYADKFGLPMIKDLNQLVLATSRTRRVWILTHGGDSPEEKSFTRRRGRYVFVGFGMRVFMMVGGGAPS